MEAAFLILKRALTAAALLALTATVALPFARAHFAWRDLADAYIHLVRIYVVDAALSRLDFFPRWIPDLYLGYGYPLLNFYAPLTYYLGSLLHRLGATIYGSLQLLGALSALLGASGAYVLTRHVLPGSPAVRAASLFAAGAYVLAPYPFLTNLYVRAAIPEALALGILPWLFVAVHHAVVHPARFSVAIVAAGAATLILTHNVTALITLPLLGLFASLVILGSEKDRLRALRAVVVGLLAGLALSAFFWLPSLAESRFVQLDLLRGGIYDYRTWLFDPLSGVFETALAHDYSALDRAVPVRPSLSQLALICVTALYSVTGCTWRSSLPWIAIALLSWLLNTTWSDLLWQHVPLLSLTQFPWRFYGLSSLALAIGGASAGTALFSVAARRSRQGFPVLLAAGAIALVIAMGGHSLSRRPLLFAPDPLHDVDARLVAAEEYDKYGAGTTSGGEFLPRTAQWDDGPRDKRRGIRVYDELYPQVAWQVGLARIISGRAAVTDVRHAPNRIIADVDAAEPTTLAFHQLMFPGWRAYVDGTAAQLTMVPPDPTRSVSLGFITVPVAAGRHRVEIVFGSTLVRTAGAALSAAAMAVLGLVVASRTTLLGGRLLGAASFVRAATVTAGCAVAWIELAHRPLCCAPTGAPRTLVDLATAVRDGRGQTVSPLGRGSGLMIPFVDLRYLAIGTETRRWLYMHPPSEVSVALRVPTRSYLQTALAIDPAAWSEPVGDGVRFVAEFEAGGVRTVILDRALDPRSRAEDRRWVDVWADLAPVAGLEGRLILRTEARGEASFDWAGWAHPQAVEWRTTRPVPSAPHPW